MKFKWFLLKNTLNVAKNNKINEVNKPFTPHPSIY